MDACRSVRAGKEFPERLRRGCDLQIESDTKIEASPYYLFCGPKEAR